MAVRDNMKYQNHSLGKKTVCSKPFEGAQSRSFSSPVLFDTIPTSPAIYYLLNTNEYASDMNMALSSLVKKNLKIRLA